MQLAFLSSSSSSTTRQSIAFDLIVLSSLNYRSTATQAHLGFIRGQDNSVVKTGAAEEANNAAEERLIFKSSHTAYVIAAQAAL
jgi:hypothetical protein